MNVTGRVEAQRRAERLASAVENLNDILTENRKGIAEAVDEIKVTAHLAQEPLKKLDQGIVDAVDVLKELPATLILRPFDFETLAVRVYRFASDERLAEASTAALAALDGSRTDRPRDRVLAVRLERTGDRLCDPSGVAAPGAIDDDGLHDAPPPEERSPSDDWG